MAEDDFWSSVAPEQRALQLDAYRDIAGANEGYRRPTETDYETRWSDYPRVLGSGALNLAASVPAIAEYATNGYIGQDSREYLSGKAADVLDGATPVMKHRLGASFIPGEGEDSVWDNPVDSLFAKTVSAAPSLIASIIPSSLVVTAMRSAGAGLAATSLAAVGTARATSGALQMGDVLSQIYSTIEKTSDENLYRLAPVYKAYIDAGMDPKAARQKYMHEAEGLSPVIAGAISTLIPGVESQVAKGFAGDAAVEGVLKGAFKGATSEAIQEGIEGGVGAIAGNVGDLDDLTWRDILAASVEGAAVGGAMGGVAGGIEGRLHRKESTAPVVQAVEPAGPDQAQLAALEAHETPVPKPNPAPEIIPPAPEVTQGVNGANPQPGAVAPEAAVAAPAGPAGVAPAPAPGGVGAPSPQPAPDAVAPAGVSVPAGPVVSGDGAPAAVAEPVTAVAPEPVAAPVVEAPAPVIEPPAPTRKVDLLKKKLKPAPEPVEEVAPTREGKKVLVDLDAQKALDEEKARLDAERVVLQKEDIVANAVQEKVDKILTDDKTLSFDEATKKAEAEVAAEQQKKPQKFDPEVETKSKFSKPQAEALARGTGGYNLSTDPAIYKTPKDLENLKSRTASAITVAEKLGLTPSRLVQDIQALIDKGDINKARELAASDDMERAIANQPVRKGDALKQAKRAEARAEQETKLKDALAVGKESEPWAMKRQDLVAWVKDAGKLIDNSGYKGKTAGKLASPERAIAAVIREFASKKMPSKAAIDDLQSKLFRYYTGNDDVRADKKAEQGEAVVNSAATVEGAESAEAVKSNPIEDQVTEIEEEPEQVEEEPEAAEALRPLEEVFAKPEPVTNAPLDVAEDAVRAITPQSKPVEVQKVVGGRRKLDVGPKPPLDLAKLKSKLLNKGVMASIRREKAENRALAEPRQWGPEEDWPPLTDINNVSVKPIYRMTVGEALEQAMDTQRAGNLTGLQKLFYGQMRGVLANLVGRETPIYVLNDYDTMVYLARGVPERMVPASGVFNPRDGTIVLAESAIFSPYEFAPTLIHELVHAAFFESIRFNKRIQGEIERIFKDAYDAASDDEFGRFEYAFSNIDEFVSEAFSNNDFILYLSSVPGRSNPNVSMWQKFKEVVKRALGLGPQVTLLDDILDVGGKLNRDAQMRRAAAMARLRTGAPMGKVDYKKVGAQVADRLEDLPAGMREAGLKIAFLDRIRQWVGNTDKFGEAVHEMVRSLQAIEPLIRKGEQESQKIAQAYITWADKNPERAAALADLGFENTALGITIVDGASAADVEAAFFALTSRVSKPTLTTGAQKVYDANKHLIRMGAKGYQGIAGLKEAYSDYEKLGDDGKKLYRELRDHYRKMQAGLADAYTRTWLDLISDKSPSDIAMVRRAVEENKFGPDIKAILGETLLPEFERIAELRLGSGDYFPSMREGEHIVTGRLALKVPTGATLITNKNGVADTLEFRADTKKAAKAAAKAYIERMQREGGPTVIKGWEHGDDASDQNDHGYRVRFQINGMHAFESRREARAFIAENPMGYATISPEPLPKSNIPDTSDLSPMDVNALVNSVEKRLQGDENKDARELATRAIKEASFRLMTGTRVQHRMVPRRNVRGASQDFGRGLLRYAHSSARQLARMEYMPTVRSAFVKMRVATKEMENQKGGHWRGLVMNELNSRLQSSLSGSDQSHPFIQNLKMMSYIDKLMSPAWSVINSGQPWMVTLPIMAAKFGVNPAGAALAKVYGEIGYGDLLKVAAGNTGKALRNFNAAHVETDDPLGDIVTRLSKAPDGAGVKAMLDEMIRLGRIDPHQGFELATTFASGQGQVGKTLAKLDRVARQLPTVIEQINRVVTATAAYRLAIASGMGEKAAIEYAADMTTNTQGDYSVQNAPSVFNHPIWGAMLQFKKYGLMMYSIMGSAVNRALHGATPEEKKIARKELYNIVAVQILAAGALGVPGMEVIKIAAMALGAFGIGGGADDMERAARESLARMIGRVPAEMFLKGTPRLGGYGIDLSSRLGMDSLLTFGEPREYKEDNVWAWAAKVAVGAPGALIADTVKSATLLASGDWVKGVPLLPMPKILSDTMTAGARMAYGTKSENTGKQTQPPIGPGTALVNSLGFRTAAQSNQGEKLGSQYKIRGDLEKHSREAAKLKNEYAQAETAGERTKAYGRVLAFNKRVPESERIKPDKLQEFVKSYKKAELKGTVVGPFRVQNTKQAAELKALDEVYGK